jgi:hypothetical protein
MSFIRGFVPNCDRDVNERLREQFLGAEDIRNCLEIPEEAVPLEGGNLKRVLGVNILDETGQHALEEHGGGKDGNADLIQEVEHRAREIFCILR